MKSYRLEGIVLKRTNLKDVDRLITLFSKDQGKVTLLAKGVRRLSSKRGGTLELFNHVLANVIKTNSDIDILGEVQLIDSFSSWRSRLGRVTVAYQLVELVDKLTPERQPQPILFDMLHRYLSLIGSLGPDWQQTLDSWFIAILKELGYWPNDTRFNADLHSFIEDIIERPLRSRNFLSRLK